MASQLKEVHENASSQPNGSNKEQTLDIMIMDDKTKTMRHPRWTKEETLVLIHCKKVVESRIREGQACRSIPEQNEPKWDSISSYCQQHDVNRTSVQCRKRWSNLLCDFKKIKTWELGIKEEADSFWMMRYDLRKEMKLPGFFDREVYDVLEAGDFAVTAIPLSRVTSMTDVKMTAAEANEEDEDEDAEETEVVFDSSRCATAEDGLFSDLELSDKDKIDRNRKKETIAPAPESSTKTVASPKHISDKVKKRSPGSNEWTSSTSQERWKQRRFPVNASEDTNMGKRFIKVLEMNGNMLNTQLEAQNINCQRDREQRKEHSDSLVAAVNKLTDALIRIADKLPCNTRENPNKTPTDEAEHTGNIK